jgi:hypothetical protein
MTSSRRFEQKDHFNLISALRMAGKRIDTPRHRIYFPVSLTRTLTANGRETPGGPRTRASEHRRTEWNFARASA